MVTNPKQMLQNIAILLQYICILQNLGIGEQEMLKRYSQIYGHIFTCPFSHDVRTPWI